MTTDGIYDYGIPELEVCWQDRVCFNQSTLGLLDQH